MAGNEAILTPSIAKDHLHLIHEVGVMSRTETGKNGFTNMGGELVAQGDSQGNH